MVDSSDEIACILIEKENKKGRKGTAETNLLELIGKNRNFAVAILA